MTEANEPTYPGIAQSWGIAAICVLSMLVFSPVIILLGPVAGKGASTFIYYLLAMGAAFYFAHWKRKSTTGVSEFNVESGSAKVIVLASIATIALQTGITTPLSSMIPMPELMKKVFLELAGQNGSFSFLTIVIAAPVLEELIFRGIILEGLLKKYSPAKSIIISSVLFGIVHLNPWQFIAAFVIGIFSGWLYYKTRNLTLSILIHAVNNLVGFIGMSFVDPEKMLNQSLLETYGGLLNTALVILGALAVGAISIYYIKIEVKKLLVPSAPHDQLPREI